MSAGSRVFSDLIAEALEPIYRFLSRRAPQRPAPRGGVWWHAVSNDDKHQEDLLPEQGCSAMHSMWLLDLR